MRSVGAAALLHPLECRGMLGNSVCDLTERKGFTVKKLLAFVLTFVFACTLSLGSVGCSKGDKDKPAADKDKAPAADKDKDKPK